MEAEGDITNHRLRVQNVRYTHILDFLRREETKLDLLYRFQRRRRRLEVSDTHLGGILSRDKCGANFVSMDG
jgi:hypothetical protein